MSHGLERNDTMFAVKERPWHRLGTVLDNPPSTKEAIILAGLNWEVKMEDVYTKDGIKVPAQAAFRSDDRTLLGVHGLNYTPLHNLDSFEFFDPFIESGSAFLETAGSIHGGKKVFITAKINSPDMVIVPKADDRVEKLILLSNSHDGTSAVRVGYTPTRVVCQNTLAAAIGNSRSSLIRVKHGANVKENLEALRETMNLVNQTFEATAEQFRFLASRQIVESDLKKFVQVVFNLEKEKTGEFEDVESEGRGRVMEQVIELFETGRGNYLNGVKGTRWAAYNAVTEYLTHYRGRTIDSRFNSLWFNDGARISKNALNVLTEAS